MKLLDFLRTHNELIEILIEGSNPYATQRLPHADVDTLRNQLANDERIRTHAQGRCVGEGRTSWVVTSQALLVMHTGRSKPVVRRIALSDIETTELQKGRYGHALRITARSGQRASIYGLARTHAVLTQRALAPTAAADVTLPDDEVASALHDFLDLQLRAQPVLAQAEAETRALLAQAAARARAEGLLRESEATV